MALEISKIDPIVNWQRPTSQKEVKQFLGLSSDYRRYIQDFATIANPLDHPVCKNLPFVWGKREETAFFKLK